jgi:hypothetical protein
MAADTGTVPELRRCRIRQNGLKLNAFVSDFLVKRLSEVE